MEACKGSHYVARRCADLGRIRIQIGNRIHAAQEEFARARKSVRTNVKNHLLPNGTYGAVGGGKRQTTRVNMYLLLNDHMDVYL